MLGKAKRLCHSLRVHVVGSSPVLTTKSAIRGLACRNSMQVVDRLERQGFVSQVAEMVDANDKSFVKAAGSNPVLTSIMFIYILLT